jgi:putative iron-only hydrogenase system regulator
MRYSVFYFLSYPILVPHWAQGFFIFYPMPTIRELYLIEGGIERVETRVAIVGIIVENKESAEKINSILHEYGEYILGRMGIPYPKRRIQVITIVMDAPNDIISALSGKLGMLPHVNVKTMFSKVSLSINDNIND